MSEVNSAMQEFNDLTYTTRIKKRRIRPLEDKHKAGFMVTFSSDPSLRNIINGMVAKEDVHVHEYESIGRNIINRMIGQPVFSFSFKRKDKAKTLGN